MYECLSTGELFLETAKGNFNMFIDTHPREPKSKNTLLG